MFEWDDQELVNVIWDKAGGNEDHIVPYPGETYEKVSHQDGFGSLPSNATELDVEHTDEKPQVDNGLLSFDQSEDRDASSFVDYGWANMGSFDDLDRILSNNDLVYGDANTSNEEALWSSHKDVTGCPEKPELMSIDSPKLQLGDIRSDCEQVENRPDKDENHGKVDDHSNTCLVNLPKEKSASEIVRRTPPLVYPIGAVKDETATGKMGVPLKSVRCQETQGQKSEARQQQTSCGPWFSLGDRGKEFEGQQTGCSPHKQFIPSPGYNNIMENQHSSVPQFYCGEVYLQGPSGSSDKTLNTPLMSMSMTPEEKIEKLRRRQQMRALLAIRKQQQQFRPQVSCNNYSNIVRNQMQFTRAGNMEIDESLGSLDSSSPHEQSETYTIPTTMDKSRLEDTILHQLENVITRLDIQIRLCIRDSLFRLAHSALRRQCDTNRDAPCLIVTRRSDGETKTNPMDRAVAHLLFHTPSLRSASNGGFPTGLDDQHKKLMKASNNEIGGGSIEASSLFEKGKEVVL